MGLETITKPHPKAKPVIDEKTGKTFVSAVQAAKHVGCSKEHLRNQLNGNLVNKTTLRYL